MGVLMINKSIVKKNILIILFMVIVWSCSSKTVADSTDELDITKAHYILSKMTIDDKVGQMTQVARDYLESYEDIKTYRLGSILSGGGSAPPNNSVKGWREMTSKMQDYALSTPLGIPLLYGSDAVHGHGNLRNAVIFPHHIGLGAANNEKLVEEIAKITALECAATGVNWNFNPCITVPQDIRWGRTYEGFSSNPEIVSRLGVAEVKGLQYNWNSNISVLACLKHFVADGGTNKGIDRGNSIISDKELEEIHLYPYYEGIKANAGSVMASFSKINSVPMHQNESLLTGRLKNDMNFQGLLVSDWAALTLLPGSSKDQIAAAINAGIDMVMVPDKYKEFINNLKELVKEGRIPEKRINDAVLRILTTKIKMGLFENPKADPELESLVGSDSSREVAREAVAQSLVILKNDKVLPMYVGQRVLIVGEFANDLGAQCGGWTTTWQGKLGNNNNTGVTILKAVNEALGKQNVVYLKDSRMLNKTDLSEFDLIIYVTGEEPYAEMNGDNPYPSLSRVDMKIIDTLDKSGKKTLLLLISGRPLLLDGAEEKVDAIVASWLPGTEAMGITDVLMGWKEAKGRLPYSWPADSKGFVQGLTSDKYLYPIGYGLSL